MQYLTEKRLIEFYQKHFPSNDCVFNRKAFVDLPFRPNICDYTTATILNDKYQIDPFYIKRLIVPERIVYW